jgi:hypothetical protein
MKESLIQKFAKMHYGLCDAIDMVNSTFSIEVFYGYFRMKSKFRSRQFQLVPGIVFALTMGILSLYEMFHIILKYDGNVITSVANMLWGVHFFYFMTACVCISSSATKHVSIRREEKGGKVYVSNHL